MTVLSNEVIEKNLKQVQKVQLEILKEFIKLCKNQNLTYFAAFGTALGAFRHQGFIPWDDDIDIGMPRDDYEKFLKMQHLLPDNLVIQHPTTDSNYPLYLAKIRMNDTIYKEKRLKDYDIHHGIDIDIFVYDCIPNNFKQIRKTLLSEENKLRRSIKKSNQSFLYEIKYFLHNLYAGFKGSQEIFKNLDKEHTRHNNSECKMIGNLLYNNSAPKEWFFPTKLTKFEDIEIMIPNNIQAYLEKSYGEYYMTPPPLNKITYHKPVEIKV